MFLTTSFVEQFNCAGNAFKSYSEYFQIFIMLRFIVLELQWELILIFSNFVFLFEKGR